MGDGGERGVVAADAGEVAEDGLLFGFGELEGLGDGGRDGGEEGVVGGVEVVVGAAGVVVSECGVDGGLREREVELGEDVEDGLLGEGYVVGGGGLGEEMFVFAVEGVGEEVAGDGGEAGMRGLGVDGFEGGLEERGSRCRGLGWGRRCGGRRSLVAGWVRGRR